MSIIKQLTGPVSMHILLNANSLPILRRCMFVCCSNETTRNPRETRTDEDTRPQLVCPAILCHNGRRTLRRTYLADFERKALILAEQFHVLFHFGHIVEWWLVGRCMFCYAASDADCTKSGFPASAGHFKTAHVNYA